MGRGYPITAGEERAGLEVERHARARLGKNKTVLFQATVGVQPRCQFRGGFRIRIDRGRDAMCSPAFEESFPARDAWLRGERQLFCFAADHAPTLGAEFA